MIGSIILTIIALIFPAFIIWAIAHCVISDRRFDKAVAILRSNSKTPCISGDVYIMSELKRYKIGRLYRESWPIYNDDEQVAVWSPISLDRQFQNLSEKISQHGAQISENIYIPPNQIERILLENVVREEK